MEPVIKMRLGRTISPFSRKLHIPCTRQDLQTTSSSTRSIRRRQMKPDSKRQHEYRLGADMLARETGELKCVGTKAATALGRDSNANCISQDGTVLKRWWELVVRISDASMVGRSLRKRSCSPEQTWRCLRVFNAKAKAVSSSLS